MMDKIDDDISDNVSTSSSEEDEEDINKSAEVYKIQDYRQNIKMNSEDYDSHCSLIKALKLSHDNDGVRAAREDMNMYFPLSSELWLEWINDERENGSDKSMVHQLFKRAIDDYRSVDIWFEYCQFALGYFDDKSVVRSLFEEAVRQVGSQFDKGHLIWETWMIYEKEVLMEGLEGKEAQDQRDKVFSLYLRQFSMPLEENHHSFDEFLKWNSEWKYSEEDIRSKFNESMKILELLRPFEKSRCEAKVDYSSEKTESETTSKEESWLAYIKFAENNMNKLDVVNLYERSITDVCLSQEIWSHYIRYLLKTFESDQDRILIACKRAVRNNKCSLELRLFLLRSMEKFSCEVDEIRATFNSTFRAKLSDTNVFLILWQAYLDFERRQVDKSESKDLTVIRGLFERLISVENYLDYDPSCALIKYWAFVEARYDKNLEKARELWSMVRKSLGNNCTALWLENLEFERRFGEFESCKRLMSNALNSFVDYPEYLFEKVLRWAAEEGNIENYLLFLKKTEIQQIRINEKRSKEAEAKKTENPDKRLKRKNDEKKGNTPLAKKAKIAEKMPQKPIVVENSEPVQYCEERTVFVSNLSYNATEDHLREAFGKSGPLEDIRIVKRDTGQSKGFAYVQFKDKGSVEEALKLERSLLLERPMYVSRSDPEKRHTFNYTVGETEKTKLFISNLPKTVTKSALEQIYGEYGHVKDVRLVTLRNGIPKGIAYVEFLDENSASKALVGTDGLKIGDKEIKVAQSHPPPRSGDVVPNRAATGPSSGAGGSGMFLVPRAVAKPMATQKRLIHQSSVSSGDGAEIVVAKKTNDEFRKFLN